MNFRVSVDGFIIGTVVFGALLNMFSIMAGIPYGPYLDINGMNTGAMLLDLALVVLVAMTASQRRVYNLDANWMREDWLTKIVMLATVAGFVLAVMQLGLALLALMAGKGVFFMVYFMKAIVILGPMMFSTVLIDRFDTHFGLK